MQKVFQEVNSLDRRCYTEFDLTEDILMEHAANSIEQYIRKKFKKNSSILIVCGAGNNGADGITLARLLYEDYNITLWLPYGTKSDMSQLQFKRLQKIDNIYKNKNFKIVNNYLLSTTNYSAVIDCLFGSGLNRMLDDKAIEIVNSLNSIKSYKIACDIPSGIGIEGFAMPVAFKANITITMGALKTNLFSDIAKDYVGKIKVASLGVSNKLYENNTDVFLLEKQDLKLPLRDKLNTHKGSFGHLAVISGNKSGAVKLCAKSAFEAGVGLVTIVGKVDKLSQEIMNNSSLPYNTTAIAFGMGLGKKIKTKFIKNNIPKVVDADIFYNKKVLKILLKQDNIILTPHPKEFCSLLYLMNIANIDIETLQKNRFYYLKQFSIKYPSIVVLLKGANSLIGYNKKIYINPFGSSILSFGGSGDIVAGIIASYLAQGYSTFEATISGVLTHSLAAKKYKYNPFSLTPNKLIKLIKRL